MNTYVWTICMIHLVIAVNGIREFELSLKKKVPNGFKFGVATASYQVEGGWNVADKSLNIWDVYCAANKTKDGSTGEETCKSYYFYKRDIEMIKFLGVDFYRFSISWTRLFPNGFVNKISEVGRKYYDNLINELIANGIEPVVTMFHWDLPQNFQDLGGWASPLIADWFEDYARMLFTLFGDRVKTWITINEPKQIGVFGYGMDKMAPAINAAGIGDYLAARNILMAHARAWHVYNNEFREKQKGKCGITIATDFREGATDSPEDIEAGLTALDFEVGLYSHPIFSEEGGFPKRVIERVNQRSIEQGFSRSRLPHLSREEIDYIRGTSDFYGFNFYSTRFYKPYKPGKYPVPSYDDDIGGEWSYLDYKVADVPHSTKIPQSIRRALNWIRVSYNNPQILITENGFGDLTGRVNDNDRVQYYKEYFSNVLEAIDDGCDIVSYTAWSLMDNFEWSFGLSVKFGLFRVNYEDDARKRTAKKSALWYKHLVKTRVLDPKYEPVFQEISF